ncbi:hypothetical protein [Pedobacter steynii]
MRFKGGLGKLAMITLFDPSVNLMPVIDSCLSGSTLLEVKMNLPGGELPSNVKSIGEPFVLATLTVVIDELNCLVIMYLHFVERFVNGIL